ncbi:MAG: cyclic nucleotide-binding domain-containing protein [Burkholderiales bacterium]
MSERGRDGNMAQVDAEATNPGRALLRSLERVGKGTAIADEIFGLVGRSLFFAEFSREDISILAGYMDVYRAQTGETIIRENDGGDFMLLIIDGAVDIFKKGIRAGQQHMTNVGPGMTLGEMSMIDGEPRFATCVATETTMFAVLHRDDMAKIILDHPSLGSKILVKLVSMLSMRLRQTSARLLAHMERSIVV